MAQPLFFNKFVISLILLHSLSSSSSSALLSTSDINHPYPKAISDLKEMIVKGFGFQGEDIKITGFDPRDAQVGHSVVYKFDVEIDHKVLPFKLLEDVNRWEYVDLPIFRVQQPGTPREEHGLVQKRDSDGRLPVLEPFQLAGPMELWVQDAKDMRISLPALLSSVLGPKVDNRGSFKLLKADVSAQTFVKIGFEMEKKLKEGDDFSLEGFPDWRTKPERVKMHFEVLL